MNREGDSAQPEPNSTIKPTHSDNQACANLSNTCVAAGHAGGVTARKGSSAREPQPVRAGILRLRNEELSAVLREGYGSVRAAWVRIVEAYQAAGTMRADVDPDHVARTMIASALGLIARQSLFGPAPVEVLGDGLRALMSVPEPGPDVPGGAPLG